jgi:hypothetical protein
MILTYFLYRTTEPEKLKFTSNRSNIGQKQVYKTTTTTTTKPTNKQRNKQTNKKT